MEFEDLFKLLLFLFFLLSSVLGGAMKRKRPPTSPQRPAPRPPMRPVNDPFEVFGGPLRQPNPPPIANPMARETPPRRPAGERVAPSPFTREDATQRPSWVDDYADDVRNSPDPLGERRRALRRIEQALGAELPEPTRRQPPRIAPREEEPEDSHSIMGTEPFARLLASATPLAMTLAASSKIERSRHNRGARSYAAAAVRTMLRSRSSLKTAILAHEILGQPLALRRPTDSTQ